MAKPEARIQAVELRKEGMSISSISSVLHVSKNSVSRWCRDVVLLPMQLEALKAQSGVGRLIGAELNRRKKEEKLHAAKEFGDKLFSVLSKEALFHVGLGIYWGEGSKGYNRVSFINSDPEMVLFMYHWFRTCFALQEEDFTFRVSINKMHEGRNEQILEYWARTLDVSVQRFKKTSFIKTVQRKKYDNSDQYYGMLTIRVRRSSDLLYTITGLIHGLKNSKLPLLPM